MQTGKSSHAGRRSHSGHIDKKLPVTGAINKMYLGWVTFSVAEHFQQAQEQHLDPL